MRWLYMLNDRGTSWPLLRDRPFPSEGMKQGVGISLVSAFEDDTLASGVFSMLEARCRVARIEDRRQFGPRRNGERRRHEDDRRARERRAAVL